MKNLKNNEFKKIERESIIEYFLQFDYGEIVTFEELAKLLGINIKNEIEFKLLKRKINIIRNNLIDFGYVLKVIANKVYYILKHNQISSFTYRNYILKPQKMYKKADRILSHVNLNLINKEERCEHQDVSNLNNRLIKETNAIIDNANLYKNDTGKY